MIDPAHDTYFVDLAATRLREIMRLRRELERLRVGVQRAADSTYDEVVCRHLNALLKGEA